MTRRCQCCANIRRMNGQGDNGPAVARWTAQSGYVANLCESCLNFWFDNADDDPDLEPAEWFWLPVVPADVAAGIAGEQRRLLELDQERAG